METTLHQQLKNRYRQSNSQLEVKLGRYRIDVVNGDRLVEIQRSGLSSIRSKIQKLLAEGHLVDVVKPLIRRKQLIKLDQAEGRETSRRWSPRRSSMLNVFDELLYFTRVFPHPNLNLITPLIDIQEIRFPGEPTTGRRRRRRFRSDPWQVQDQNLLDVCNSKTFRTVIDLQQLLPPNLQDEFDTAQMAELMDIPRHQAQQIAYVLRKTGAAVAVGKRGNAIVCRLATARESSDLLASKMPKRKPLCAPGQSLLGGRTRTKSIDAAKQPKRRKTTTRKPKSKAG